MKLQQIALMSLLGLSTLPALMTAPAQACTPAPDNPSGCDGLNGGGPRFNPELFQVRPKFKKPIGPVCLTCPPYSLKLKDQYEQIQQPVLVQEKNILLNQERLNQGLEQPYQR